jgi:preprotein translocase subunit Sss1
MIKKLLAELKEYLPLILFWIFGFIILGFYGYIVYVGLLK